MDLECEESAYDAYEYESEGCDDPGAPDEYENQMYSTWPGYNAPPGYAGYNGMGSSYGTDPRYRAQPYPSPYEDDADCAPAESQATEVGSIDGYSDFVEEECDEPIDEPCDEPVDEPCDEPVDEQCDEGAYDDLDLETLDDCTEDCGPPCGDPSNQVCPLPDPNVPCPPCRSVVVCEETDEIPFGDHGANSICGKNLVKVNEIIKNITIHTVLDEFMLSIANYTADNGEAMFDAMSNEVNNFKELIKEIYANRNDAVSELLKAEQRQMKNKYERWMRDMNKKSEETLEKIRQILPDFDLAAFTADPSNYIYTALMEVYKKEQTTATPIDTNAMNPDRNFRVGMHKRTWLMREAERIECENEERMCKLNEMMAQLACLSEGLATSNKKLAAYNRQLESHATCLRNKLAYNETILDCLTDEIELNKMEADKNDKDDECPIIQPDDILTPYPSGYDYC